MPPSNHAPERSNSDRVRTQLELRARRLSFRVPWRQFSDAVAEYADWALFSLWVQWRLRLACSTLPLDVTSAIGRRMPGFLEEFGRAECLEADVFQRKLIQWAEDRHFADAARGGGWRVSCWSCSRLPGPPLKPGLHPKGGRDVFWCHLRMPKTQAETTVK
jgi:hypothetical protein